ncbi:MAG: uncharacterized protein KVP18_000212 [Porospora cf. gigantea A]|uniref:uncharacterized protein n=1 Tax=Porospora cf. gigantea A TaxID=2853593 RepID=UPI003559969C|nr:MAG: hypothetical protein KVP18_000212 [Porospora cf. gigantea A]
MKSKAWRETARGQCHTEASCSVCSSEASVDITWKVEWGAFCRQTSSKENQDGWFVVNSVEVDSEDEAPSDTEPQRLTPDSRYQYRVGLKHSTENKVGVPVQRPTSVGLLTVTHAECEARAVWDVLNRNERVTAETTSDRKGPKGGTKNRFKSLVKTHSISNLRRKWKRERVEDEESAPVFNDPEDPLHHDPSKFNRELFKLRRFTTEEYFRIHSNPHRVSPPSFDYFSGVPDDLFFLLSLTASPFQPFVACTRANSLPLSKKIFLASTSREVEGTPTINTMGSFPEASTFRYGREPCASPTLPQVFGVLDGHGPRGKSVAAFGAEALVNTLRNGILGALSGNFLAVDAPNRLAHYPSVDLIVKKNAPGENCICNLERLLKHCSRRPLKTNFHSEIPKCKPQEILSDVMDSCCVATRMAHMTNYRATELAERDSGSTLVSCVVLGRYVVTQFLGDSQAFAYVFQNKSDEPTIFKLNVDHSLNLISEAKRIEAEGSGKIVRGSFDELRLIPSRIPYPTARGLGLSINMSRSLGHCVLSNYALSPEPEFTVIDLLPLLRLKTEDSRSGSRARRNRADVTLSRLPTNFASVKTLSRVLNPNRKVEEPVAARNVARAVPDRTAPGPVEDVATTLEQNEVFLVLMSDGVSEVVNKNEIAKILRKDTPLVVAQKLTKLAETL